MRMAWRSAWAARCRVCCGVLGQFFVLRQRSVPWPGNHRRRAGGFVPVPAAAVPGLGWLRGRRCRGKSAPEFCSLERPIASWGRSVLRAICTRCRSAISCVACRPSPTEGRGWWLLVPQGFALAARQCSGGLFRRVLRAASAKKVSCRPWVSRASVLGSWRLASACVASCG